MKNFILILAFFHWVNFTFSQGKVGNENIVIGKTDSVKSNILGENREIWVHERKKRPTFVKKISLYIKIFNTVVNKWSPNPKMSGNF
jgi:hypothetical protein